MGDDESLSHSKWECKYHVVFIPKCRRKTLYVELRRHLGDVFRKLAEQKGKQDRGRSSSAGSRAHVDLDPPQARSVAGDRIYQGKERDPLGSCIRGEEAKLRRPTLLGEGIFRIHSRTGHRGNTRVHQEAGSGGQASGADEFVALRSHLQVALTIGAASAAPTAASSGSLLQGRVSDPTAALSGS